MHQICVLTIIVIYVIKSLDENSFQRICTYLLIYILFSLEDLRGHPTGPLFKDLAKLVARDHLFNPQFHCSATTLETSTSPATLRSLRLRITGRLIIR